MTKPKLTPEQREARRERTAIKRRKKGGRKGRPATIRALPLLLLEAVHELHRRRGLFPRLILPPSAPGDEREQIRECDWMPLIRLIVEAAARGDRLYWEWHDDVVPYGEIIGAELLAGLDGYVDRLRLNLSAEKHLDSGMAYDVSRNVKRRVFDRASLVWLGLATLDANAGADWAQLALDGALADRSHDAQHPGFLKEWIALTKEAASLLSQGKEGGSAPRSGRGRPRGTKKK